MPPPTMRLHLFTDTVNDVNGVSRFIANASQEARRAGRDLEVLTCQGQCRPGVRSFRPRYRARYRRYPDLEFVLPPVAQMLRHVGRRDPSAIHVSTPGPVGLVGLLAAKIYDKPLLGIYHTDIPAYLEDLYGRRAMRLAAEGYMRAFYGLFEAVFARSTEYQGVLRGLGLPDEQILALRPGLDTTLFHPGLRAKGFWSAYPALAPDTAKLLYVGRLSTEKNLGFLAKVWRELDGQRAADGRPFELVVVGQGPHEAEFRQAVAGTRAHLLGHRNGTELAGLYANSELFLFPSVKDTLGQVVMESQACGTPALVSDRGGPQTLVADGATGRVLPVDDPVRWANAVLDLAADAPRREAMGRAAAQAMKARAFRDSFNQWWELHEAAVRRTRAKRDLAWPVMPPM